MNYFTQRQTAKMLSKSIQTIIAWRRQGRFPNAKKNGTWAIPQCDIDDFNKNLPGSGLDEAATKEYEIRVIRAEISLAEIKGERDLPAKLAEIGYALDQREQVVQRDEAIIQRRTEEVETKTEKLNAKEVALNEALEDIKLWRQAFTKDANKFRKYHAKLCDGCQSFRIPELSELDLPEAIYTSPKPVTPTYEPEVLYEDEDEE